MKFITDMLLVHVRRRRVYKNMYTRKNVKLSLRLTN